MKKININKAVKHFTEETISEFDYYQALKASEASYHDTIIKLINLYEVLAYLRGTNPDHEYDRIVRLYKMRKKRGVL